MKIMGMVAWLILLVVVSVCVVFCVLRCLQKKSDVLKCHYTISYFKKWKLWAMYFGGFLRWSNYNLKKLRPEKRGRVRIRYYDQKKKFLSSVWRVRDRYYDRKKKSSSCLSGGCAIVITTGKKKVLVVCLAGSRSLLRLEKKSSSRLSGRCAIVITTGK